MSLKYGPSTGVHAEQEGHLHVVIRDATLLLSAEYLPQCARLHLVPTPGNPCTLTNTHTHTHTHTHINIIYSIYVYVHMYMYMHRNTHIYIYIYIYVWRRSPVAALRLPAEHLPLRSLLHLVPAAGNP